MFDTFSFWSSTFFLVFFSLGTCDYWGSCKRFTKKATLLFYSKPKSLLLFIDSSKLSLLIQSELSKIEMYAVAYVSCYEKFLSAVQSSIRFSCRTLKTCVDSKTKKKKWTENEWEGKESGRKENSESDNKCWVGAWFPYHDCHFRKCNEQCISYSNLLMTMKSAEIFDRFLPRKNIQNCCTKPIMMIAADRRQS